MPQISQSTTFADLSYAFESAMSRESFALLGPLNIHPDAILAIECGIEALQRLIPLQQKDRATGQQFADCNSAVSHLPFENTDILQALLDWPSIGTIVNEFTAWKDNPERPLNEDVLYSAAGNIRRRCNDFFERFHSLSTEQKAAFLDMANAGNMASYLAHFSGRGLSTNPDFRKLILSAPNVSELEAFATFRAQSLAPENS